MPLFLLIVGLVLVVTGFRGTTEALGQQIAEDFSGEGNFTAWVVAILFIGALGYIPGFRPVSNGLLVLLILVILLADQKDNQGFFNKFSDAMKELQS